MADSQHTTEALAPGAALVGRDRELSALRARLAVAGRGDGGLVVLAGEAGIGKTRLAREFAAIAARDGSTVLWGGCYEGDWQPAYGPWVEALSGFVRSLAPEQRAHLFGSVAPVLAPLVPSLRSAFPRLPRPDPLAPAEERLRLYDAVVQTLHAVAAEQPVVLVLDDLHWADRDSLELLRYVARGTGRARLLTVGVYRDPELGLDDRHPLKETLAALHREADYDRIRLGGLTPDEVARYLTQATEQPLPQALVRAIYDETAGNPFYTREVFRHLAEEGKIVRRADRWATDFSIAALGIPEGVRRVLGRRLARLSPLANAVLTSAAFTGGVEFRILAATVDAPEDGVLDAIDVALQAGLLRVTATCPPAYDFAHAIVRHTIVDRLNPDRRARLHRRIAETLERVYGEATAEHAAELAAQFHASAALPGAERGVAYALTAAERARTGFAHERAAGFLRLARDLAGSLPIAERADILRRLALAEADALLFSDAARTAIDAVAALTAAGAAPAAILDLLAGVARTLKDGGASRSDWEPLVARGLAIAGERRDLRWARLQLLIDRMDYFRSGAIEAGRWLGHDPQAVAIARATGDEDDVARTFEPIGWPTREETEEVLALARSGTRPTAVMRALDVAARDFNLRDGDLGRTKSVLSDSLALGERVGSLAAQAEAITQLAGTHAMRGDFAEAQAAMEHARELVRRLGPGHRLHVVLEGAIGSGLAYFLDGDWAVLADHSVAVATGAGSGRAAAGLMFAAWAALDYAMAGDQTACRRLIVSLPPILERHGPEIYAYPSIVSVAAAAIWQLRAVDLAEPYHRLTLALESAGVGPGVLGSHSQAIARMAVLLGNEAEAEGRFARARSELEVGNRQPARALVDYDEAIALLSRRSFDQGRVEALLSSALTAFRNLGMEGWARRATEQMERLVLPRPSDAGGSGYPDGLSPWEVDVLRLIAAGKTNKEIAASLFLSAPTVQRHAANIYAKIGARNRAEATAYALRHGLARSE